MASAAGDSAAYGGAGGAFRRRRNRSHQSTPYDRPATAIRSSQRSNDGGWLSKIVDPASKLITAGAHKLFASVFRKRLLPPPSPPQQSADEVREIRNDRLEAATAVDSFGLHQGAVHETSIQITSSPGTGVTELESILRQKTFTRSEIDRLTALLQSRAPNATPRAREERTEQNSRNSLDGSLHRTENDRSGSPGNARTLALISKVNEDVIASPAELAKAYMGSRPTKVSPSMLGSRTQLIREEGPMTNAMSHLRTPGVSQVQKALSGSGILENSIMVPRSHGGPATYRVTASPYSRNQPVAALKGYEGGVDAYSGGPSSSQKVLKRRHSVLENDIGSVGPIRRTRQKSNLVHLRGLGLPSSSTLPLTKGKTFEGGETSSAALSPPGYSSQKTPVNKMEKGVPMRISSKSIEMGERILQQLEKLTPPREKLTERKSRVLGEGLSTIEMTPGMLHGKARRSLETVDSLRLLDNVQNGGKEVDSVDPVADGAHTSLKKQDIVPSESKNKNKITMSDLKKGVTKAPSISPGETNKNTSPVVSMSAVDVPKKSRAFQMSAHEDYLDFDDDVHSNGFASSSMNGDKVPLNKSGAQPTATVTVSQENGVAAAKTEVASASPELKPAGKVEAASFPVFAPGENSIKSSISPSTILESNKEAFAGPTVSFGINGPDKASSASLFTSPSVQESSIQKDQKSHSPSSVVGFFTPTMDSASTKEDVDVHKKPKSNSPFAASGGTSLFGTPTNSEAPMNGRISFSTATPSPASTPALFSSQSQSNGTDVTGNKLSTATTTGVGSSTSGSDSVKAVSATPSFGGTGSLTSSTSLFSFSAPSGKDGSSSTAAVTTDFAPKAQELAFGNNSATQAASSGFQFGASTTNPIDSVKSPALSNDNTSGKTVFGNPSTATVFAASTESTLQQPFQQPFSSSALSSSGSSGSVAGLTSVSPIFGSSAPASGPGFAFGSGLSTSSSTTTFAGSTQSGSTSVFGSSWKSSDSVAAFGSSVSGNQPSGFAFGASSASAPTSNSPSVFNFGESSSSAAANNNSSTGLSFGASSTSAPNNSSSSGFSFGLSSSAASSTSAPVFAFGASTSTPGSTSSSSPFQFGASSSTAQPTSSASMFNSAVPSSTPVFGFGTPPSSSVITTPQTSQPVFGNGGSMFPFGSPPGNNDQMTMEDSMAMDSSNLTQTQAAAAPLFGQSPMGQPQQQPSSGFIFGTPPQAQPVAANNPFQFGGQQQQGQVGVPQNPSLFGTPQPGGGGGSFELGGGGSFLLGAGGGNDKSNRRMVRVKSKFRKK